MNFKINEIIFWFIKKMIRNSDEDFNIMIKRKYLPWKVHSSYAELARMSKERIKHSKIKKFQCIKIKAGAGQKVPLMGREYYITLNSNF